MPVRERFRKRWTLGASCLILGSALGCKATPEGDPPSRPVAPAPAKPAPPSPNEPAADSALGTFTEDPAHPGIRVISGPALRQRLRQTGAKATVVNVWASWCGPCRREFPMLAALAPNWKAQGVELVFVSVDEPDGYGVALEFAGTEGQKPPLWVAERPLGAFKEAMSPEWKGALPASFLFDAQGELRYFWNGEVFDNEIQPVVDAFLRGEDVQGSSRPGLIPGRDYRKD